MEYNFYILENIRTRILAILEPQSEEALNSIHPNFNNNLIWNAAHCVATQQLLTYGGCGIEPRVQQAFIDRNRKGSAPEAPYTSDDIAQVKTLLKDTAIWLKEDYENGLFKNYREYQTSFGAELKSIEDAIRFNNTHEGMHLGYLMAMRKLV